MATKLGTTPGILDTGHAPAVDAVNGVPNGYVTGAKSVFNGAASVERDTSHGHALDAASSGADS